MYKTTFLGVLEAEKLQKHKCTLFSETPCTKFLKSAIIDLYTDLEAEIAIASNSQFPTHQAFTVVDDETSERIESHHQLEIEPRNIPRQHD